MNKKARVPTLIAFLLPLFGLALWTSSLLVKQTSATTVEVPIIGYDPRDLFSGHYIQFNLDLGNLKSCTSDELSPQCICLTIDAKSSSAPSLSRVNWVGACSKKPDSCPLSISGKCDSGRLDTGLERFYIPEGDAQFLTTLPPKSTLVISVTAAGEALGKELKPEGQPYGPWIKAMRDKLKEKPSPTK